MSLKCISRSQRLVGNACQQSSAWQIVREAELLQQALPMLGLVTSKLKSDQSVPEND